MYSTAVFAAAEVTITVVDSSYLSILTQVVLNDLELSIDNIQKLCTQLQVGYCQIQSLCMFIM